MRVFLAGVESVEKENIGIILGRYNLISYYSINNSCKQIIEKSKDFLLDSGAFSFLSKQKGNIDWDRYIEKYADFINQNNVNNFFELDIDPIVGYQKVIEYRKELERLTGKKCIPVWHKSRGIEDYRKTCSEYKYIAIGGIVTKEIKSDEYGLFLPLLKEAHRQGTKVHGLGFTSTKELKRIPFDSVDSTNWSFGRYGHYWEFTKTNDMIMHHRPEGKICGNRKGLQAHNLREWTKFQDYAERKL